MNHEVLEKILSCKALPSLPAIALKVIEQTSDPNVKLPELATTIQNDQGITAKVLRTVNSSFYGLRTPCSTINRALVMLGLAPVKTLVLGFSLINAVAEKKKTPGFDYVSYWRRGLYTAVATKALAEAAGRKWSDEGFLAGLLQDIGVMAMLTALGDQYMKVVASTDGEHRKLVRAEIEHLEVSHPDIGAMLAERWKLPGELVMPVRFHERPTAAPPEHADICRCVYLGNVVHDVLTETDPRPAMRTLYERAEQWYSLAADAVDLLVRRCAEGTRELSRLFSLDTGVFADIDEVMNRAKEQQDKLPMEGDAPGNATQELGSLLRNEPDVDPLTGVFARPRFTSLVTKACAVPAEGDKCTILAQVGIDGAQALIAERGEEGLDDAIVQVAAALASQVDRLNGSVCRIGNELFAAVLPACNVAQVMAMLEGVRAELQRGREPVGVSMGVASLGKDVKTPQDLVVAATKAIQAARRAGGNQIQGAKAA